MHRLLPFVLAFHLCASGVALAQSPTPEVTQLKAQLWKEKAEKHSLQAQLAQLQLELQGQRLQAERAALEAELRVVLKAKPEEVFNWQTLTFAPPPGEK